MVSHREQSQPYRASNDRECRMPVALALRSGRTASSGMSTNTSDVRKIMPESLLSRWGFVKSKPLFLDASTRPDTATGDAKVTNAQPKFAMCAAVTAAASSSLFLYLRRLHDEMQQVQLL